MSQFAASEMQPSSQTVLWSGSPSDLASAATGGRITRAAYSLTEDAVLFEAGVMTTRAETIPLHAVMDVDLNQSMTQKARGVADLTLRIDPRAAAQYGQRSLVLRSIKDARTVKDLITRQANTVRAYWNNHAHERALEQQRAGASQFGALQQPQQPAPIPTQAATASDVDLMSKLKELAEMKSAGTLTDDEFTAAKAQLLADR
jgi:hypothetical protein